MDFKKLLENEVLIFDGAMGTMLKEMGLDIKKTIEVYNFTHRDIVKEIHEKYIEAGSNIITTNTFGVNDIRFKNDEYSIEEIICKAINIAKEARKGKEGVYIAYDIGPTGIGVKPLGKLDYKKAYEIFKKQIITADSNNVDFILIETVINLEEAKVAIRAAKDNSNLPIFCTVTLDKEGKAFDGNTLEDLILEIDKLNVDALGINCSPGAKEIYKIIERISNCTEKNIIVEPNTRYYEPNTNNFSEMLEEEFSNEIIKCIKSGARIIGGCCGTTPKYIKKIKEKIDEM